MDDPYIHICLHCFLILCLYFHLLFLTLLSTRHILQFTMFDLISLQPPRRKKKCRVNYNQAKCPNIIIFSTKYEFFLPLYQLTFFLAFGQTKKIFSYHILMNILRMNYYKYFVTKKCLNNIP